MGRHLAAVMSAAERAEAPQRLYRRLNGSEVTHRPGICMAMSAHLLPRWCCSVMILRSSSSSHGPRLIAGSKWLYHRSRHCLPRRPGR